MEWTTVYLAFDSADAHLVRSFLESVGIRVFIKGELVASNVSAPVTTGGIEVQVPAEQVAEARNILAAQRRISS